MYADTPLAILMHPDRLPDRRDARTFARSMLLLASPTSPEAEALVSTIVDTIIAPFRATKGQLRPTMLRRYREALAPFVADLFQAASLGKWSKLRTNSEALEGYPGGRTAFSTMRAAMVDAGLLEELAGFYRDVESFGTPQRRAATTSFRPTVELLRLAEQHGITLSNLSVHFAKAAPVVPKTSEVVEARKAKAAVGAKPERLPVDMTDPQVAAISVRLGQLNSYLLEPGRVDGITFAGLRRVFSNADQPGFQWQWGGRFYSMPWADAYENMDGGSTSRAETIRIDGQEVCEVDLSAAHLAILHALRCVPFDGSTDPYALPGLERDEVKRWVQFTLGASDPDSGGKRCAKVRQAGLERFPVLSGISRYGISTHDLQFHEAEVMFLAMEELRDAHGVGFLPVHDALIVPKANRGLVAKVLRDAFLRYFESAAGTKGIVSPRIH